MTLKKKLVCAAIALAFSVSLLSGCSLFEGTLYPVQSAASEEATDSMNDWTLEGSVLNGAPLEENKSVYEDDDPARITTFYVTVYPTVDDEGDTLTLADFDQQVARVHTYNPTLNCLVQEGDENGLVQDGLGYKDTAANATIRVRGNSSRGAELKSYKIDLYNSTIEWENQSSLNLNKHYGDPSKVAQKFSMDLMAELSDMASLRTRFVRLYIKDLSAENPTGEFVDYGLYTQTEQPNKTYMRSHGLDENGTIYKAEMFNFAENPDYLKNVDDPDYNQEAFETILDIREGGKDHSKLLQMLRDINDYNQDFDAVFDKYFNKDNYLTWMAVNFLLGNEDTTMHNFMLYSPENSLTWYFLPWDYDGTFRYGAERSAYYAPDSLYGVPHYWPIVLHRRFLQNPDNVELLVQKIEEIHSIFTSPENRELLEKYKTVLRQFMDKEPDISHSELPPNEIEPYIDGFMDFMEDNYQKVLASIQYPMPSYIDEPKRLSNGDVQFGWEASYDLQNDLITYDFTLARDPGMTDVVYSQNGYIGTQLSVENLPAGTYYCKLIIRDDKGHQQYGADNYQLLENGTKLLASYWGEKEVVVE
jgi:hypothetical protein